MKSRFIVFLSTLLFLGFFFLKVTPVLAFSGFGDGTSTYPFQITTCNQLKEMANNLSAYYEEDNDIDCNAITFNPIGSSSSKFTGNFNGNNFAITNIAITNASGNTGFFAETNGATIQNVRLISGSVSAPVSIYVGSLVGQAINTTISHCSSSLSIPGTSDAFVGGLIGFGTTVAISKSFYSGTINTNNAAPNNVGGIAGGLTYNGASSIVDSYASGTWNAVAPGYSGGINTAGYGGGSGNTFTNVYSSAVVTLGNAGSFGGLSGASGDTVSNSFAAVTTSGGTPVNFGGAYGSGTGTSTNVYYDSSLTSAGACSGSGGTTCTAQATSSYFKGNSTNAPMSSWDFTNTWQTNSGAYPTLRGFTSPASINPDRTPHFTTASAPVCIDLSVITSPNLFQIDSSGRSVNLYFTTASNSKGYNIYYGNTPDANQFADSFDYSGPLWIYERTISSLNPNTKYYFKVQAKNGCNASKVGNMLSATTVAGGVKVLGASTASDTKECSYTVSSGDSLWQIAENKLGDPTKYKNIISLTPNLSENSILQIGETLTLCK
ncbi:hypothetical protein BH10PAT1_BH10PAT1_0740 [soil metagenome]